MKGRNIKFNAQFWLGISQVNRPVGRLSYNVKMTLTFISQNGWNSLTVCISSWPNGTILPHFHDSKSFLYSQ